MEANLEWCPIHHIEDNCETMLKVICTKCGWIYNDPNPGGMGIHRSPTRCGECSGKMVMTKVKDE